MVIGIAGGSGSGKTTFAKRLLEIVGPERGIILGQDSYYKDQKEAFDKDPRSVNFDHPSVIDFELLTKHLRLLKGGKTIECPIYDYVEHARRKESKTISPKPIIIVEGILIFTEKDLLTEFDLTFFMEAPEELRLRRRITRDQIERGRTEEETKEHFYRSVKPMHDQFVQPTKMLSLYIIQT